MKNQLGKVWFKFKILTTQAIHCISGGKLKEEEGSFVQLTVRFVLWWNILQGLRAVSYKVTHESYVIYFANGVLIFHQPLVL